MSGSGRSAANAVASSLRRERTAYEPEGEQPIGGYLTVMGAYLGCVGVLTAFARRAERPLPTPGPWDVMLTAGAVHRLSRLVAKDSVTSPVRLPFARFRGQAGPAELAEDVRGEGVRRAIGELITCPFCAGLWISTGLTAGQVLAPQATRLVSSGLSALALSDLLHFARAGLQEAASR
ncbi:DUF1360 domain-containing protein [Kitasatospora sp. NPDC057904]|uniref:DUF1360 domain-containing protein n=1 Tax=unclassified Kitasatospora TaxID=2633591 RepID=UPI0036D94A59